MSEDEIIAAAEGALADDNGGSEEVAVDQYVLVTDTFPSMNKLEGEDSSIWKCDGAPNWRRLAGFPIYATGK